MVSALLLCAGVAGAEVEAVSLQYHTPDTGCPARSEFEAEVRARTTKVAFGASGRRFDVRIERGEVGYVGTLSISEADAVPSERRIDGLDCAEVASSLGLIAALAVDPEAKTAPRSELRIEPAPAPAPAPKEPEPAAGAALQPPRPEATPAAPSRAEPESPKALWAFSIGLGAFGASGPAPKWLVALGPEAELRREASGRVESAGLALLAAETGSLGPADDRASFRWLVARLSLCPWGVEDSWRVRACAALDAGVLHAEGQAVAVGGSATRGWFSTGLAGRFGRRFGERLYVDLSAAALVNVTRDRFVFETPRTTVHEIPVATFSGGISAGLLFP